MKKMVAIIALVLAATAGGWFYMQSIKTYEDARALAQVGNEVGAAKIWLSLAESGDAASQQAIGMAYYFGNGVERDRAKAAEYYTLSAAQGEIGAQYLLANMYRHGVSVTENPVKAAELFALAAAQGDSDSQNFLGEILRDGEAGEADKVRALMWFLTAYENGKRGRFRVNAEALETQLTESEILEATTLATACVQSSFQNCGR